MAHVFISYKRDEREAIERIASRLKALGLSVWFDASLSAGETFNAEIDREAREAKVVLVCWSPAARQSEWVNAEAMIGFEQKKLAACYVAGPDGFSAPTPFNANHAEDLRAWLAAPTETHPGWKSVLRRVGKLCGRSDIESWGALDAHANAAELRAWVAEHETSPIFTIVNALLRARDEEDTERMRLEEAERERRAAERRGRKIGEKEEQGSTTARAEANIQATDVGSSSAKANGISPWVWITSAACAAILVVAITTLLRSNSSNTRASVEHAQSDARTASDLRPNAGPGQRCIDLAASRVSVSGLLTLRVFPGLPNFESVANGDEAEEAFILELPRDICIEDGAQFADPSERFRTVHVVTTDATVGATLRRSLGSYVTVSGEGIASQTGHHHAPLVLFADRIVGTALARLAGQQFDDCGGAGWCPRMVVIPAGSFLMGSPLTEAGRAEFEGPQRRVTVHEFAASKFEITYGDWAACVSRSGCSANPEPSPGGWGNCNRVRVLANPTGSILPVPCVSWNDAGAYLRWLSRETGQRYRLLTEAEWEYAARAGTTTAYSTGHSISASQARFGVGYSRDRAWAVGVGTFPANAFGLYDTHGNVWEWVEDCWHPNYVGAPTNGSAWVAGDCSRRVLRGGGWFAGPEYLRSSVRDGADPDDQLDDAGFRVARDL